LHRGSTAASKRLVLAQHRDDLLFREPFGVIRPSRDQDGTLNPSRANYPGQVSEIIMMVPQSLRQCSE
jgi:hypothetical protein